MDWQVIEKLSPSLAWPLVSFLMFLIALPILYGRLNELIKAVLAIRDLPKSLQEMTKEHERLVVQFKTHVHSANEDIEKTAKRVQVVVAELSAIRNELQALHTEAQEDALAAESRAMPAATHEAEAESMATNASSEQMFVEALGKWANFTRVLENRLKAADIEYDMRRIGRAAYALTDRRRRAYLTREEADLITSLARQARRFNRLADTRDEWLTPDVYFRFVSGVDTALAAISRQRTNGLEVPTGS